MTIAQITAALRAIEERLTDPDGQLQQAYHDLLRTYGLTAQLTEVATQQRDQIQALAEVVAMLHGRIIEHERAAIAHGVAIQSMHMMLEGLIKHQYSDIAHQAADARALLHEAAAEQIAELEEHAEIARALLRTARMDAVKVVQRAVHDAQDEIATAAEEARDVIQQATEHHE